MTSRGLTNRNHPRPDLLGSGKPQQTFSGTDTFLRRKATREVAGADVVVSGLPFDLATTFRPRRPIWAPGYSSGKRSVGGIAAQCLSLQLQSFR